MTEVKNTKKFIYVLKAKEGPVLLEQVVEFGSSSNPFPKDWKEDVRAVMALENYKDKLIRQHFEIKAIPYTDDYISEVKEPLNSNEKELIIDALLTVADTVDSSDYNSKRFYSPKEQQQAYYALIEKLKN
jgi:hypothetical protein